MIKAVKDLIRREQEFTPQYIDGFTHGFFGTMAVYVVYLFAAWHLPVLRTHWLWP